MYLALKESHNKLGMIVLFLLLVVVLTLIVRFLMKKPFDKTNRILALVGMIAFHLQFTIGIILYFLSPLGSSNFSGEAMGNKISRFYIIEHPVGMLLALIFVTLGNKMAKKASLSDKGRYSRVIIFFTLALAIVYYFIPWFLWQ